MRLFSDWPLNSKKRSPGISADPALNYPTPWLPRDATILSDSLMCVTYVRVKVWVARCSGCGNSIACGARGVYVSASPGNRRLEVRVSPRLTKENSYEEIASSPDGRPGSCTRGGRRLGPTISAHQLPDNKLLQCCAGKGSHHARRGQNHRTETNAGTHRLR